MAHTVFVHVGAPKTGTSYLQRVLWTNRQRLRSNDFHVPGRRHNHYEAMGDLRGPPWFDPQARWTWDRMAERAASLDGTVIITEEMLGAASPEQARSALDRLRPAEVHVVVTARDLVRAIPSAWQQGIRARSVGTFDSFVAGLRTDANPGFWDNQMPLPIFRRWCETVPPEHRHLVTLPAPGADRVVLWHRFADALGLEPDDYDSDVRLGNPSLGAVESELLRRVNVALGAEFPLSKPYLDTVRRFLTLPVLSERTDPAKFGLPPSLLDWATEVSEKMVAELREYPCVVSGDLEDLLPPATTPELPSPDDLPPDVLLEAAVGSIVGMLRNTAQVVGALEEQAAVREEGSGRPTLATPRGVAARPSALLARLRALRTGR